MHVHTIIEAGWVMPMAPKGALLTRHSVLIDEGKIVAGVSSTEKPRGETQKNSPLPAQLVFPWFF